MVLYFLYLVTHLEAYCGSNNSSKPLPNYKKIALYRIKACQLDNIFFRQIKSAKEALQYYQLALIYFYVYNYYLYFVVIRLLLLSLSPLLLLIKLFVARVTTIQNMPGITESIKVENVTFLNMYVVQC